MADMRTWAPEFVTKFDTMLKILSFFLLSREDIEAFVNLRAGRVERGGIQPICNFAAEDMDPEDKGARYDEDKFCVRDRPVRFMGQMPEVPLFKEKGGLEAWKRIVF